MLDNLNLLLQNLSSNTLQCTIKANTSKFTGKKMTVRVTVSNFLGDTKNGSLTFVRENKELPQAFIATKVIESKVSTSIVIKGEV